MFSFRRRRAQVAGVLTVVALACGACGSDAGESPDSDKKIDTTATLRFASNVPVSRFDPHRAASASDVLLLSITYDRLIHRNAEGDPVPGLATKWAFTDDASALDLTLRKGVTFHDGEKFTPEAVIANIERAKNLDGSTVAAELDGISKAEKLDANTVRLQLSGPAGALPLILSDRAGMMISPKAFDNDDLDLKPVGAGMYTVTENRPGDRIVYERYDDYWAPKDVKAAKIEARIMEDSSARLNSLEAGELDLTTLDPSQLERAEAAGLQVEPNPGVAFYHLQMAYAFKPFSDKRVRQALNYAIDRKGIVKAVLFGTASATTEAFPPNHFAYDKSAAATYSHDPKRAIQLLKEAGFGDGFEFEMTVNTLPEQEAVALAVQAQLAKIGVKAKIKQGDPAQIADWCYGQQKCEGMLSLWTGRADPAQTLDLLYAKDGYANLSRGIAPSEKFTKALLEGEAVGSQEERTGALQKAAAQATIDALDVPIAAAGIPLASSKKVVGMHGWAVGKLEFRGVGRTAS